MPPSSATNPLLDFSDLPRFDAFEPALVTPALDSLLADAEAALTAAIDPATPADWDHVVAPLDDAVEKLGRAWGIVGHLSSVDDTLEVRDVRSENLPRMTRFWTELGQNSALFARYKELHASPAFKQLSAARQRVIENALRNFRLGGAELVSPQRERYVQIQDRLAKLQQSFSENVLDSTNAFAITINDEKRLAGLPDDAIEAARADAQQSKERGYRFTLQAPSYLAVMRYADDRKLREQIYRAYATRASELASAPSDAQATAKLDNTVVIDEILTLRAEEAGLLGFDNYAQISLAPKMAESTEQVITFLRDLAQRARPSASRDLAQRNEFAARELGLAVVEAWDAMYVSEKLRESLYAFSDQEVKSYFQLPRVLQGLFSLAQNLFDVQIKADTATVWHESVQFFRIERGGELIGQFYADLFARTSKRPGAWMDGVRSRARCPESGAVQTPAAYLVCNFQPPAGGKPALLTHIDVETLFHEFGHGLHHMLTRIDDIGVSGISGVEWDAVELPSQFMENFSWEWPIVESMSAHVDTGACLPKSLFDKMLKAKNFEAGLQTLRQVEFSLFDMLLHSVYRTGKDQSVQQLLNKVHAEVAVVATPAFNRFQNSFSHIFAGGYSAGYYSYQWAEVLSADAYAAFEEAGQTADPKVATVTTGRRFLDEILAVGGSRPAIDSFRAFRGRDPEIAALLRHNGMDEPTESEPHHV